MSQNKVVSFEVKSGDSCMVKQIILSSPALTEVLVQQNVLSMTYEGWEPSDRTRKDRVDEVGQITYAIGL